MSSATRQIVNQTTPRMRALSMRANMSWTLIGNMTYAATQWGVIVVIARLASPEAVGQYALGLAITAPIMLFASLKLRALQATDARCEYAFGHYLALRLIATMIALVIIAALAIGGGYSSETLTVILLVAAIKAFDSLGDIVHGFLQQRERMDRIALSRMFTGVTQVMVCAGALAMTRNVVAATAGMALVSALVALTYDVRSARLLRSSSETLMPVWDWTPLRRLAALGVPAGLTITLGSLTINIPRYVVAHRFDERDLGMFAAISAVALAGGMLVTALAQSAAPRLALYYAARNWRAFDGLLVRLIGTGTAFGAAGLLGAILFGHDALALLYGAAYAVHTDVLVWMMAACALQFGYVFLGSAINAMRRFTVQLPIQVVSCLIVAGGSMALVGPYGLAGGAMAICGANLFEAIAHGVIIWRIRRSALPDARR